MSRLTQLIVVAFAASYWVLAEAGVEVEVLKKGKWSVEIRVETQMVPVGVLRYGCPGMTTRSAAFFQRLQKSSALRAYCCWLASVFS